MVHSAAEPHEWHDRCQSRSAWFVLTDDRRFPLHDADHRRRAHEYHPPVDLGHPHPADRRTSGSGPASSCGIWGRCRKSSRAWDLRRRPPRLRAWRLHDARAVGQRFSGATELCPEAQLCDASPVIRTLMSVHTPLEIERIRKACEAGVWIHDQVPHAAPRRHDRARVVGGAARRASRRNFGRRLCLPGRGGLGRPQQATGRLQSVSRGHDRPPLSARRLRLARHERRRATAGMVATSTASWMSVRPSPEVLHLYQITWECNQAMAEAIEPGNRCSDIYQRHAPGSSGGTICPSAGPDVSVMGCATPAASRCTRTTIRCWNPAWSSRSSRCSRTEDGWFDLEDQYLVTADGTGGSPPARSGTSGHPGIDAEPLMGIAIACGQLLDGTAGRPFSDGAVMVEGDRIVAVGPAAELDLTRRTRLSTPGTNALAGPDGLPRPHRRLPDAHRRHRAADPAESAQDVLDVVRV